MYLKTIKFVPVPERYVAIRAFANVKVRVAATLTASLNSTVMSMVSPALYSPLGAETATAVAGVTSDVPEAAAAAVLGFPAASVKTEAATEIDQTPEAVGVNVAL